MNNSTSTLEIEVAPTTRDAMLGVYRPPELRFVAGEGSSLISEDGRAFLDFTSGIGVNALGFGSPVIRAAIEAALDTGLIHTSNLFRTAPAEALASRLIELSFPGKVFFCNSGAEAGEASLKFARRAARAWLGDSATEEAKAAKHQIVAFKDGFHGRLHGTLAITDRPAYQAPFAPLMPGAVVVDLDDSDAIRAAVSAERTAAIIVEPILGEGGVRPVSAAKLMELRALCDEVGAVLIFDEVQCGIGRTGEVFAWQESSVLPDLLALAKPIGGGLPMGAVILADRVAETIQPGDHATTFGGGPLVASVALAVLETVAQPDFLAEVRRKGALIEAGLIDIASRHESVLAYRGRGLMWGLELSVPVADLTAAAFEAGVLLVGAGPGVLRLLPPLTVTDQEIERVLGLIDELLS